MRFIRPLLTALSVLALTAAAVSAHPMPTASADGLATAAAASGHAVAAGHLLAHEDLDTNEAADETELDQDQTDAEDATEDSTEESHCIAPTTEEDTTSEDTTSDTDAEQVEEPNHGAVVCGAAQAETPDGYANHGAYVSEVARDNHGHETSEAAKAAHASVGATHAAGHGKGHNS